jgi:Fur family transcriptional regulator, iron response regulator
MDVARDFRAAKILAVLREAKLRPTRQRVALAHLLFDRDSTRHITAEQLYAEAEAAGVSLSLATVYNCLHQFTSAGLLREVALDSGPLHFDTNVTHHHHMVSSGGKVACVDTDMIAFSRLPQPPLGEEIDHVDVVIWTRKVAA